MSAELTDAADRAASDADIRPVATSAVEDLVVRIRSLISDRHLGVGDSLPSERELCELFATSRNTVREAMRSFLLATPSTNSCVDQALCSSCNWPHSTSSVSRWLLSRSSVTNSSRARCFE